MFVTNICKRSPATKSVAGAPSAALPDLTQSPSLRATAARQPELKLSHILVVMEDDSLLRVPIILVCRDLCEALRKVGLLCSCHVCPACGVKALVHLRQALPQPQAAALDWLPAGCSVLPLIWGYLAITLQAAGSCTPQLGLKHACWQQRTCRSERRQAGLQYLLEGWTAPAP